MNNQSAQVISKIDRVIIRIFPGNRLETKTSHIQGHQFSSLGAVDSGTQHLVIKDANGNDVGSFYLPGGYTLEKMK